MRPVYAALLKSYHERKWAIEKDAESFKQQRVLEWRWAMEHRIEEVNGLTDEQRGTINALLRLGHPNVFQAIALIAHPDRKPARFRRRRP